MSDSEVSRATPWEKLRKDKIGDSSPLPTVDPGVDTKSPSPRKQYQCVRYRKQPEPRLLWLINAHKLDKERNTRLGTLGYLPQEIRSEIIRLVIRPERLFQVHRPEIAVGFPEVISRRQSGRKVLQSSMQIPGRKDTSSNGVGLDTVEKTEPFDTAFTALGKAGQDDN